MQRELSGCANHWCLAKKTHKLLALDLLRWLSLVIAGCLRSGEPPQCEHRYCAQGTLPCGPKLQPTQPHQSGGERH